ncbi:DUF2165 family protein [Andreprevotia chitinilytica]|uniref:DUF2165 family protein n=1 Tax=Andreprevotia chitinilytica TaxID=396808 RepID=UPI00054F6055|nr:DUF2165 family protein [Andreprevotia chitinilytica]
MRSYYLTIRLALIVLALFPTLWGLFSFLNNVSGFEGTAKFAVAPMLAMTDTYGNPAQTWRAISAPWAAQVGLVMITATETLAGLLGLWSIIKMARALKAEYPVFASAKIPLILSCVAAVSAWGLGFMVVAGDWFLAWQSKGALATQLGGMIYTLPCFLVLIAAIVHKE